ncbi:methionyl-tRNA formyltransferase [Croceibacter atlanticus]|jgi:methionyl-tRNA formyltransferase|uniref:Methionyl-tRNA formyltransferase n=1 Tax=Croceibacter atlanticus (strain ATCC BAA-628 / JCM 21780 / CIP 108009 / IAM 15332 / KCTC 12090 / HTCC2559) TaxID=216432 RepID=A3U8Z6_CROAH|nr:methionyl-tRNA formyltransferase [Croceibacter atlanticus]EAP86282.1 methionyl-tRNA formyltransferase [Croceibacter atlanticus HTCC2559]MBW4968858.1 methionyl-tRNA formyltransferase [Croceibacter atlanticus]
MRDLRILFMGTPEFATTILDHVINEDYNVVGVVTAPDKPAGRGRKIHESHVKGYAVKKGLKVLQPTNLKSEEFSEQLNELDPNVIIVVAFRMLPKQVWQYPEYGTFNLHASLLPQYRGAAPIHWAIINGETTTGVSTFFIDEKIDTGEMILQKETTITPDETVGDLHDKLMNLGCSTVTETLKLISEDTVTTTPQPQNITLKTAYKLNNDNTRVDWSLPVNEVYNKIRGLNPFPVAYTILYQDNEELRMKLYKVRMRQEEHSKSPGTINIEDSTLKIAAKDGFILVEELQLPGKRKMAIKDLLNGFSFKEDSYVV